MLLNLVALLDSAVPSLDFEQINVFLTSGFDSVNIVFDSLSVSRSIPELYFLHSVEVLLLLTLRESIYGYGFHSISIAQFPAIICSVSAEGSLNCVAHSI